MKYAFIRSELTAYPLSVVCRVLGVTQSGYHAWNGRLPSRRQCERDSLSRDIHRIFEAQRGPPCGRIVVASIESELWGQ